jgi:hypothetical protein
MNSERTEKMKGRLKNTAGALALAVALVALPTPVSAQAVDECLAAFHGVTDTNKNGGTVMCTDCDPTCDTDKSTRPNRICKFRFWACVNEPDASGVCSPGDINRVRVKRVRGQCTLVVTNPLRPAGTSAVCGDFSVSVPTRQNGTRPGQCTVRLKADAGRRPKRSDTDLLTFQCIPQLSSTCPTTTTTLFGATTTTISGGSTTTTTLQAPVVLGSAGNFAILAGSTVTNTGPTMITGDLGLSPGSSVTGFPPGTVIGMQHVMDPTAAQAQLDLTTAFNDAAGRTVGAISVSGNLGGLTLAPGLYKSMTSLAISSGDLTLDGQGDPNARWIFQMGTTLVTTVGRQVMLIGGAKASNIVWQVGSSATIGMNSVFKGNILADQSITLVSGATLDGRALTRIAAVTMDTNTVTLPAP